MGIESELLGIVTQYDCSEYDRIIKEKKSWPILYHLATQRANIIEWIPIDKQHDVLELGADCGALTGTLAAKARSVTCIESSAEKCNINYVRNRKYKNINIIQGAFSDIEPELKNKYDYITLIGSFDYAKQYVDSENPHVKLLVTAKKHLKKNGKLVIATDNKFGLKYWAGCREEHTGNFFAGLEGSGGDEAKTFGRSELIRICEEAGFTEILWFYPYPDYRFADRVYSDDYLPLRGELNNNIRNFDKDRLVLFDETKVFNEIIENNMFPFFSNSFLMIIQ